MTINICFAQPTLDISIDDNLCIEEQLNITNDSNGFDSFIWDFCIGDFNEEPTINSMTALGLNFGSAFELIEDEGYWYGFALDRGAGRELFRYDFGNSPLNDPVITEVTLSDGLFLTPPDDISILKYKGLWYGVIGYRDAGGEIIRLDFGESINNNTPEEQSLGNFGFTNAIRSVELHEESGNLILVLAPNTGLSLWRVDYGDSFDNIIDPGTDIIKTTAPEADLNRLTDFDIKMIEGEYIVHCVALNASKIMRLNFGSSLLNTPSWEATYDFTGSSNSSDIKLLRDGSNYFGYVSNPLGSPAVFNFGDLITVQQPNPISYSSTIPIIDAIDIFKYDGRSYIFGVNTTTFIQIEHFYDCPTNTPTSEEVVPLVFYEEMGMYEISVTGFQSEVESHFSEVVTVSGNIAPSISYTSQNICQSSPVQFTSESPSSGLVYSWDFGDATTSTEENPSHTYAAAGVYEVTLEVSNGTCGNFTRQTITVYDEPVPTFSAPG
ncbi:MAG: PKD domain-containing protein, partial [Bacteroidota bacterium]